MRRLGRKFDAPVLDSRPTLVDPWRPGQPTANCNAGAHCDASSYRNPYDGAVVAAKWNPSATRAYVAGAVASGTGTSNPLRVTDTKQ